MAIKKRVQLFGSALREIVEGSTTSATFRTSVPMIMRANTRNSPAIYARGIRLLLSVTGRTSNDGVPLSLTVFLENQDSTGTWWGMHGSTMTPVVTATASETLEIYPGVDVTTVPLRRSMLLPGALRAVAKLNGSITATPGMTFSLDAELFE